MGDRSEKVTETKNMLKSMEYRITSEDNHFDREMRSTVLSFQNDCGLPITGTVDETTFTLIAEALAAKMGGKNIHNMYKGMETTGMEQSKDNMMMEEQAIMRDEDAEETPIMDDVIIVEEAPSMMGTIDDTMAIQEILAMDDMISTEEMPSMDDMSMMEDLPEDFIVTTNEMPVDENEIMKAEMEMSDVSDHKEETPIQITEQIIEEADLRPRVCKGDTGVAVVDLQKILKMLGYYEGEIDGIFGRQTLQAVLDFQKSSRLIQDGIVGEKTWSMLERGA